LPVAQWPHNYYLQNLFEAAERVDNAQAEAFSENLDIVYAKTTLNIRIFQNSVTFICYQSFNR
jgi:hypothetical protein